ncbi:MAG: 3-hydroxyacyl-CoA dehydrogenase family protein [Actinomycetia bacterium]|nr:3-hydroxyacyl-CoA dehydrogenase family protein [Actinomycetes bacterium]
MSSKIAIIGAGLMGAGIAQVAAVAGYDVVLRDLSDDAIARGTGGIEKSLSRFVAKNLITQEQADAALARIATTTSLEDAVRDADIVVEAVFEDLDIKSELFAAIAAAAPAEAILASNTSAIPITQIAAATDRPEQVVGMHFFSPVPMMALCELVRGYKTSDETLARAREFAESIGKTCVVVNRDVAGFVTTRLICALSVEAAKLVESGVASAEDVDVACRLGFGHAMGPLQTADLTGVDILTKASQNIYRDTQDEKFNPPELLQRMVVAGDLGRKSGQGFYDYS